MTGVVGQGAFLKALGIGARAAALATVNPDRADMLERQVGRLVDAEQMGELFKAAAVFAPRSLAIPGFESRA